MLVERMWREKAELVRWWSTSQRHQPAPPKTWPTTTTTTTARRSSSAAPQPELPRCTARQSGSPPGFNNPPEPPARGSAAPALGVHCGFHRPGTHPGSVVASSVCISRRRQTPSISSTSSSTCRAIHASATSTVRISRRIIRSFIHVSKRQRSRAEQRNLDHAAPSRSPSFRAPFGPHARRRRRYHRCRSPSHVYPSVPLSVPEESAPAPIKAGMHPRARRRPPVLDSMAKRRRVHACTHAPDQTGMQIRWPTIAAAAAPRHLPSLVLPVSRDEVALLLATATAGCGCGCMRWHVCGLRQDRDACTASRRLHTGRRDCQLDDAQRDARTPSEAEHWRAAAAAAWYVSQDRRLESTKLNDLKPADLSQENRQRRDSPTCIMQRLRADRLTSKPRGAGALHVYKGAHSRSSRHESIETSRIASHRNCETQTQVHSTAHTSPKKK